MSNILIPFILIASGITVNKFLLGFMTPVLLVGIRMLVSGLILVIYNYLNSRFKFIQVIKANFVILLIITLTTTYIPSILKAYALENMQASRAAFFGLLDPFVTGILAFFILKEKFYFSKIIGIIIGLSGTIILIVNSNKSLGLSLNNNFYLPELAAVVAVIVSRFGWVLAQSSLKKNFITPSQLNSITMVLSGILSFVTGYFTKQLIFKNINTGYNYLWPIFLIYTIIVGNIIAYGLYANQLKKHTAMFISVASFTVPLFVKLLGIAFFHESISVWFFVSFVITLIGFFIFSIQEKGK